MPEFFPVVSVSFSSELFSKLFSELFSELFSKFGFVSASIVWSSFRESVHLFFQPYFYSLVAGNERRCLSGPLFRSL